MAVDLLFETHHDRGQRARSRDRLLTCADGLAGRTGRNDDLVLHRISARLLPVNRPSDVPRHGSRLDGIRRGREATTTPLDS